MNFSIHVLHRSARSNAYSARHKDTIRQWSSLCRDGATGIKWRSQSLGGDSNIQFSLPDPGQTKLYRVQMEEVCDLYLGTTRICQGIADQVPKRNRDKSSIDYDVTGHAAWIAKKTTSQAAATSLYVHDWLLNLLAANDVGQFTNTAWLSSGRDVTWLNSSQVHIDSTLFPTGGIRLDYSQWATGEKIMADLLQVSDYEWGIYPGPDAPNQLGCYFYWQPRVRNKVNWIITRDNLRYGKIDIELNYDYYNSIVYKYVDSGSGVTTFAGIDNSASQSLYTPGSKACAFLDLTAGNGQMTASNASACAQKFLNMHSGVPLATGSLTLPMQYVLSSKGTRHAALIRAWDNVRIPHLDTYQFANTIDDRTTFHVYEVVGDVDANTVTLQFGETSRQLDAMIANLSTNKR